jgi:hypothetical protein
MAAKRIEILNIFDTRLVFSCVMPVTYCFNSINFKVHPGLNRRKEHAIILNAATHQN